MKKLLSLALVVLSLNAMERPKATTVIKKLVPSLRTLCLICINMNKIQRTKSTNNLIEQVEAQENVYKYYIERGLDINTLGVLKTLLENNVQIPEKYRLLPAIFQKWPTSSITKWKAQCLLEPFTCLLKFISERKIATREEFFDALNLVRKEQPDSYALASFLIQIPLENNLSNYPHGNVATVPFCNIMPTFELKQFLKTVIMAKIPTELKNSMLRRSVHQKIAHGQIEYEPIITCLLENGADKTILSSNEQKQLDCAIEN